MATPLVIVGTGGHAISATNVALSSGYKVVSYVDDKNHASELSGIPIIKVEDCLSQFYDCNLFIAIGDNYIREKVSSEIKKMMPNARFPSLIHSASAVGWNAKIGAGSILMPFANVGPNSVVGSGCIINTGASIDHDCHMSAFSSIAPGVFCGGNVHIGTRSAISIGANVKHGINIGSDVVIGANSYVNSAIDDNIVAYGSPCRKIRYREKGDLYLG
ncbi:MAG: NeuD/PglB/VioB family sugar acetyltransferase [Tsuneonella suprasediminis]|nr:NeuD/PglB/VioB family sugar acetyltransferase [Altererythrobacter sp. N1]